MIDRGNLMMNVSRQKKFLKDLFLWLLAQIPAKALALTELFPALMTTYCNQLCLQ